MRELISTLKPKKKAQAGNEWSYILQNPRKRGKCHNHYYSFVTQLQPVQSGNLAEYPCTYSSVSTYCWTGKKALETFPCTIPDCNSLPMDTPKHAYTLDPWPLLLSSNLSCWSCWSKYIIITLCVYLFFCSFFSYLACPSELLKSNNISPAWRPLFAVHRTRRVFQSADVDSHYLRVSLTIIVCFSIES